MPNAFDCSLGERLGSVMMNYVPGPTNLITDVRGIKVGNAQNDDALTGVTVLVCGAEGATASVDVRGGAPGTRDTDALHPSCLVEKIHAITLSGGSIFGLEAASGVISWLSSQGVGMQFARQRHRIPIVPSAILFDLNNGGNKNWGMTPPYRELGIEAAKAASTEFSLGNAGAGLGATAGRLKGGLGSASARWNGFTVGALSAVNPVGSVVDPRSGDLWARPYEMEHEFGPPPKQPAQTTKDQALPLVTGTKFEASTGPLENTTISVVATDAPLDKAQCLRVAIMSHDGMARAIRPIHAVYDGDSVFSLATGTENERDIDSETLTWLGTIAADCLTRAIARAVCEAASIEGHPSWRASYGTNP